MGNCCSNDGEEAVDRKRTKLINECVTVTWKGATFAGEKYTDANAAELKRNL